MRQRLFLLSSALWMPLLISCGGGGGGGEGLSGVLNVASFVIPAGETRTVTGDLVVNSVGDLVIEGELKVVPGARVALYSEGDINIHEAIGTAPSRGRVSRQAGKPDLIIAARNVVITEKSHPFVIEPAAEGGVIAITTFGENGRIEISQNLVTKQGKDSKSRDERGGQAGNIYIGSVFAIQEAIKDGHTTAAKPRIVSITSTLTTGRGGHGFTDTTGAVEGGQLVAGCTGGGYGGTVDIDSSLAPDPVIRRERIVLGRGGNAGSCGTAEAPIRAKSGSSDGEAGQSLSVILGPEGLGGELYVQATISEQEGEKGLAGNVFAAAGNGGPGGKGGDTTIQLTVRSQLHSFPSQVHLENGGNGGAATRQFQNGGRGGNVTIEVLGNQAAPAIHTVALKNYGNGAVGFSGCSASPTTPGSSGGAGGSFTIPLSVAHTVQDSCFAGGRAGDGDPPGVKGAGGTLSKDNTRYPDGAVGATCTAASTLSFSQTSVSLFTNEEQEVTLTRTGRLARATKDIQVIVRSTDGRSVNVRNLADNTIAKRQTLNWPAGQASINLRIVGGVNITNDSNNILATIDDPELGVFSTALSVINSQRLTTGMELIGINGTRIPAGTVLENIPDGIDGPGRIRGIAMIAPNSACSSWHAKPVGSSSGSGASVNGEAVNATVDNPPCGWGLVIQPTGPTDP